MDFVHQKIVDVLTGNRRFVNDLIPVLKSSDDSCNCASADGIVVQMQADRPDLGMLLQILLQCHRDNIVTLGFEHTCQRQQMVFMPVLPLIKHQRGKAQGINGRFKDMDGVAPPGQVEGVVLVTAGCFSLVIAGRAADSDVANCSCGISAKKHRRMIPLVLIEQVVVDAEVDDRIVNSSAFEVSAYHGGGGIGLRQADGFGLRL